MSNRLPTADFLHACFRYVKSTGVLYWRVRPEDHFPTSRGCNVFNAMYAGRAAGSVKTDDTGKSYVYVGLGIHGRHFAHRIIWKMVTGQDPSAEIDHHDQDGLNNRWRNLREATSFVNARNHSRQRNNTTGVTGVLWMRDRRKWRAAIRVNRRNHYLGDYTSFDDAVAARKAAEKRYNFHRNHGQ